MCTGTLAYTHAYAYMNIHKLMKMRRRYDIPEQTSLCTAASGDNCARAHKMIIERIISGFCLWVLSDRRIFCANMRCFYLYNAFSDLYPDQMMQNSVRVLESGGIWIQNVQYSMNWWKSRHNDLAKTYPGRQVLPKRIILPFSKEILSF